MKKNLKQIRNERILSQQELANLSGISLRTIQRIEKSESKGSPYIIRSLCKALDIDPQSIDFESDDLNENAADQLQRIQDIELIGRIKMKNDCGKEIKYINFSSLIVLLFPFANLISAPIFYFLFKKKLDTASNRTALKILSFQIIWSIGTLLFMVSTPLVISWFSSIPASMLDIPMFVWVYWFMLFFHLITTLVISFHLDKKDHPVQFIPNVL